LTMGAAGSIGDNLFRRYLLPFELASVLLLVAIIGVVTMLKRSAAVETSSLGGDKS